MKSTRSIPATFVNVLASLAVFAGTAGVAAAQGANDAIPANSSPRDYGRGWACDRGYRRSNDDCVAIAVPANG